MKTQRVKKFKPPNSKRETRCHKCLTYGTKKYISKWLYFYCENTSLHGFRYVSMGGSTILEAIFWFAICVLSIVFCVILMLRLWASYSNNPIATTIDTSNPITDLAFPGVTICNNNKVYRPRAEMLAKLLQENGFTKEDSENFFNSLPKLIRPGKISIDNVTASQALDYLGMSVITLMEELMQPCNALLVRCSWIGQLYDCNKIFKTVKSKEGFCCAFNSHYNLNVGHNINDTRFDDNSTEANVTLLTELPGVANILKAPGSGRDIGLSVALNVERATYKATSRPHVGASVLIHDPIDFPDIGAHIASALPGHILSVSVSCTSITSMDSLRSLPIEKRSCYFDEEVAQDIRYSYQSCISMCFGNHTKRACGCLPFFYPEIPGMQGVKTCYLPDTECLLNLRKVRNNVSSSSHKRRDRRFDPSTPEFVRRISNCRKCLPQCTDLTYRCNVESNVIDDDIGFESDITRDLEIRNISFVHIFFGDVSYVDYRKESTISWDALLASFGGIFGLCLGGSVISVIEAIYLLFREIIKRQMRRRQKKSRKSLPPASEIFLSIPVDKAPATRQILKLHPHFSLVDYRDEDKVIEINRVL